MLLVNWLVIAAVMIVAEIMSLGLTTIWFAGGALIAAILAYFEVKFWIQLLVFAVVSLGLLLFTRPIVAKHMIKEVEKTNVESLIGEQAIVKEKIDNINQKGSVHVNGLEWTARSADNSIIEAGKTVTIKEVKGVKLIVEEA